MKVQPPVMTFAMLLLCSGVAATAGPPGGGAAGAGAPTEADPLDEPKKPLSILQAAIDDGFLSDDIGVTVQNKTETPATDCRASVTLTEWNGQEFNVRSQVSKPSDIPAGAKESLDVPLPLPSPADFDARQLDGATVTVTVTCAAHEKVAYGVQLRMGS